MAYFFKLDNPLSDLIITVKSFLAVGGIGGGGGGGTGFGSGFELSGVVSDFCSCLISDI